MSTVSVVKERLESRLKAHKTLRRLSLLRALEDAGVPRADWPEMSPSTMAMGAPHIDHKMQQALSQLVRRTNMSLPDLIRLWRGETPADPRPNKALDPTWARILLRDYAGCDRVLAVMEQGVSIAFSDAGHRAERVPRNHKSAMLYVNPLIRGIRKGQDDGTYLVVDLDVATTNGWEGIHFSPFGCVPKKDADPAVDARVIHDLSYGDVQSTNDLTIESDIPPVRFIHVRTLAQRIELLALRYPNVLIKMMKGDVKGAFRHIPLAAWIAKWFAGSVTDQNVAVIDLALPFGWTASPAFYGLFGGAISHLVSSESPQSMDPSCTDDEPFFGYEWVDDHVLMEVDRGVRLDQCENALRLAMLAVLGPHAINEQKFSAWSTSLHVLGLEWDTVARTVSMPEDKIAKATLRIDTVLKRRRATKSQLSKLLGSLRHICSCVRPAKPFYQRIVSLWRRLPRFGSGSVHEAALLDLRWFAHILHSAKLRSIPTSYFCDLPEAHVHLYMDASNTGLCVLHPARREYLRLEFDAAEQLEIARCKSEAETAGAGFTINVREHLSVVLGLLVWGSSWTRLEATTHVKCWIDNQSAVAWCNSLYSRNLYSQELNRIIGAIEARFGIHVSASHLAGSSNFLADLGSRTESANTLQEDLQRRVVALQHRSIADTSFRLYESTWRQWCAFRRRLRLSIWLPQNDPTAQSLQLVMFAVHCSSNPDYHRPSFATIRAKISHVGWYHCVKFGSRPCLTEGHQLALTGLRRVSTPSRGRDPITITIIHGLISITDFGQPQQRVLYGATLLGFFFLLRRSEYLSIDGKRHQYCMQVADVTVLDSHQRVTLCLRSAASVQLRFRASKTDQLGTGTVRSLNKSNHPTICPVFAAVILLRNAQDLGIDRQSPLCSLPNGKVLSARTMTAALQLAATRAGSNCKRISTHSLRVGGATALFHGGVDAVSIQFHGRWRSDVYKRYTRISEAQGRELTLKMMGQQSSSSSTTPASPSGVTEGSASV